MAKKRPRKPRADWPEILVLGDDDLVHRLSATTEEARNDEPFSLSWLRTWVERYAGTFSLYHDGDHDISGNLKVRVLREVVNRVPSCVRCLAGSCL